MDACERERRRGGEEEEGTAAVVNIPEVDSCELNLFSRIVYAHTDSCFLLDPHTESGGKRVFQLDTCASISRPHTRSAIAILFY